MLQLTGWISKESLQKQASFSTVAFDCSLRLGAVHQAVDPSYNLWVKPPRKVIQVCVTKTPLQSFTTFMYCFS